MALIVEDGTGLSTAESYISVADANAYFAARGNLDWDALDDTDDKEPALRRATDYMLNVYRTRWKGYRANSTQALDWPRQNVQKPVGNDYFYSYYLSTQIPIEIKYACAELALRAASEDLSPDISSDDQLSSVQVGPIAVSYKDGSTSVKVFRAIEAKLALFLISSSGPCLQLVRT